MRSINFYYIYDNINECVIGDKPFYAPNDLAAAICFRDSFINCKDSKYNYKALDLVRFASADITSDGEFIISTETSDIKPKRILGSDIMNFIREKCIELGIEDDFIEEEKGDEK